MKRGRGAPRGNQNARRVGGAHDRGRDWARKIVDDPKRRKAFEAAVDAQLKGGGGDLFLRCFDHGYGRPPQALDVKVKTPGIDLQFKFPGGILLPASATGLSDTDSDELVS